MLESKVAQLTAKSGVLSRISLGFLALFAGLMAGAAWVYPGGSWLHPQASGHRFFENFWCDLLRQPAHNGHDNALGAALGVAGFVCLALSLAPFWLEVSRLLAGAPRRFVRVAGVSSAIATALVALMPSDRFPVLHAPVVLTAGTLGFGCGALCGVAALRKWRSLPMFAATSGLLLTLAAMNLALYVNVAYFHGETSVVLPALQKLATAALIAWIAAGLWASANHPKP